MNIADLPLSQDTIDCNPWLAAAQPGSKPVVLRARVGRVAEREPLVVNGRTVRSRLEERAWLEWVPQQGFAKVWYEPFVLHLAGGNYTPDIGGVTPGGELWLIEVKGSWKAYQSGRSSKRNLRQAAVEFAALGRFFSLMPDGRARKHQPTSWRLEEFK